MEIKYEAVFGDQELLSEAGIFTGLDVVTRNVDTDLYSYCRREDLTYDYLRKNPVVAMRRIIRTPTWTVADQKAGKLPEVGMIGALKNGREIEYLGKSVGGTLHHVRFVDDGECIRISLFDFFPIESPEEKAARLRKEWCKEAAGVCRLGMTTLTRIYDALLSGDLPVPNKG